MNSLKLSRKYFQSLLHWGLGYKTLFLVSISVVAALTEGLGLGLLIPVLELLQTDKLAEMSSFSASLQILFKQLNIPFNLPVILGGVIFLLILQAIVTYIRGVFTVKVQSYWVQILRKQLFNNLLSFDLAYFHKSRQADLVNGLTTESVRAGVSYAYLIPMVALLVLMIAYVVVQLIISWQLTVVTLPILAILAYFLRPKESYKLGADYTNENEKLQSVTNENLSGIREVKILGLESFISEQFAQNVHELASLELVIHEKNHRFTMIYQICIFLTGAFIIIFANKIIGLALAPLLTFLLVIQRLAPRVATIVQSRHWWLGYSHSLYRVEQLIQETDKSSTRLIDGSKPFKEFKHSITLHDVIFQYIPDIVPALQDVSVTIPHGKMTAIIGSSGAGKSTLMDLIIRFYDPTQGQIKVDGQNLQDFQLASWRQAIGMVSQENFLFNDTILNNISCASPNASVEEIQEAARQAYAHEFIMSLPEQYETNVGDRGIKLSGGQRQRLALARALLRKPQLLLLDEATSDLDTESERYIQQAIREVSRSCTVIVIAHRLSTIEHADNIIVLEKGQVVEQGQHQQLLALNGRYAEYYRLQFGDV